MSSSTLSNLLKLGKGQQKVGKVKGAEKKELDKQFATNYVNWQLVSRMMGNKRALLKMMSIICGTISE